MKIRQTEMTRRGFTMVELMVVVTLIALLTALATPTLSRSVQRGRAKDAAREVSAALRNVRSQAMSRGQAALVRINPQRGVGNPDLMMQIFAGRSADGSIARSCETLDGALTVASAAVGTVAWSEVPPDMVMLGATQIPIGGTASAAGLGTGLTHLCMSPDGRVLTPAGQAIIGTFGACQQGFMVVMSRNPALVEAGFANLVSAGASNAITCVSGSMSATQTAQRRLDRDLVDAYAIEVTFNGAVEVTQ